MHSRLRQKYPLSVSSVRMNATVYGKRKQSEIRVGQSVSDPAAIRRLESSAVVIHHQDTAAVEDCLWIDRGLCPMSRFISHTSISCENPDRHI